MPNHPFQPTPSARLNSNDWASLFDCIKQMKNFGLLAVALTHSIAGLAQSSAPVRLQCDGTYTSFVDVSLHEIPVKGILLEISEKQVKVAGAPGFDSIYQISAKNETGVLFTAQTNQYYSGQVNRFSGQLSLTERGEETAGGAWKAKQTISAVCKKATPLF